LTLVFDPPKPVLAATTVAGLQYPVRRVICVGRNYAAHAREMGMDPDRDPPFFFTKWAETVVPSGAAVTYPPQTQDYQFEAELVVAIGKGGRAISADKALDHVYGYATGLDMTRRDLQMAARGSGRPWDAGKNFEEASPLGLIHPVADHGHFDQGAITLTVNGETKQSADLRDLIWPTPDIIAFASSLWTLEPGDLIYTGTPAGVGPVVPGDKVVVSIAGLTDTVVTIGAPAA
jgi:fumarylpyruvate hydrolase